MLSLLWSERAVCVMARMHGAILHAHRAIVRRHRLQSPRPAPPGEITTSITSVMLKEERKATCQALFLLTLSLKLKVKVNTVNRVAI